MKSRLIGLAAVLALGAGMLWAGQPKVITHLPGESTGGKINAGSLVGTVATNVTIAGSQITGAISVGLLSGQIGGSNVTVDAGRLVGTLYGASVLAMVVTNYTTVTVITGITTNSAGGVTAYTTRSVNILP